MGVSLALSSGVMTADLSAQRTPSYREAVAAELRAALARRGLSGSALARLTGQRQTYISARTRGAVALDTDDLELFASALEIDPVELMPRGWKRADPAAAAGGPQEVTPLRRHTREAGLPTVT